MTVLEASSSLDDFLRDQVTPLDFEARYRLVTQARVLLDGIYVHLPLKRAMHAIDPLGRLRLLERRLQTISDLQFHAELASIFRGLRDLHTAYQLPDPYRGNVALLGFLVERYHLEQDGPPRYLITKAASWTGLSPGEEVVAWNGIPMARAVELNAERQAGSNPGARMARGLEALTLRPLQTSPPPDERWVVVELAGGKEVRLEWRVVAAHGKGGAAQDPTGSIASALGIDAA